MRLSVHRLRAAAGRAALLAFGVLGLAFMALPLVILIAASFSDTQYLRFPPSGFTLAWYVRFLTDTSYLASIWLSAWLAALSTAIALVLGVPASIAIARGDFPGRQLVQSLFLSPLILPTIVIGVAVLQLGAVLGVGRNYPMLVAGHVVIVIPYIVRTTVASLAGFDRSLEEASRDLGASAIGTFFLVTLPIIKPGIIAGSLFALIISWINVELSIFNSVGGDVPIPVKLFNYIQYSVDPLIAAVSAWTIYIAIIMVVVIDWIIGIDRAATVNR